MATKPQRKQQIKKYLRHQWTPSEIQEKGGQLAQANREVGEVREDAKRVASDFKAKIANLSNTINTLSNDITTGYTMRDTDCEVVLNKPKSGKKTTIRLDTKEVVSVEDMTQDEMQEELDLAGAEKGSKKKFEQPVVTDEQAVKIKDGTK